MAIKKGDKVKAKMGPFGSTVQGVVTDVYTGTEAKDGRFYDGKEIALVNWQGIDGPGRWPVDELIEA